MIIIILLLCFAVSGKGRHSCFPENSVFLVADLTYLIVQKIEQNVYPIFTLTYWATSQSIDSALCGYLGGSSLDLLWNPELQNIPWRTLKTVEYSLLCHRVQGESVPNKNPDVSERPSFIPPTTWLSGKDTNAGRGAGGEGVDRGWDGWMASWWTWVWVNSRSWWWTGRPGVLQFMGSQRVGHHWATELNWTEHDWLHVSNLFVVYDWVLQQVGARRTNI